MIHRTAADQALKVALLDQALHQTHGCRPALQDVEFVVGQQPLVVREDLELAAVSDRGVEDDRRHGGDERIGGVVEQTVLSGQCSFGRPLSGEGFGFRADCVQDLQDLCRLLRLRGSAAGVGVALLHDGEELVDGDTAARTVLLGEETRRWR